MFIVYFIFKLYIKLRNLMKENDLSWMNLQNIMLSEGSQTQKVTHYMIAFV